MRSNDTNAAFSLRQFGLRFTAASTESNYREWRSEQNIPVVRLIVAISIPPWLAAPWLGYYWRPDIEWMSHWWLGYVLISPMFALVGLSTFTNFRRWSTGMLAFTLCVAGLALFWIAAISFQTIFPKAELIGPAIAVTILMIAFASYMRLPPGQSILAVAPYTGLAGEFVLQEYQAGSIDAFYPYTYLTTMGVAFFQVGVMSVVNERFFRRAFVNETLLLHSRNLIRRYVPSALADQITAGHLGGGEAPQRRRVTVLFADIVGFTEIADRVEPEVMTQIVGEYMAEMSKVVDDHGGTVNEFIGDGLMALFGAPVAMEPDDQAMSAVRSALTMQSKLPELNGRWRKLGLGGPVRVRIGINTGMASVGSYGSEGRMTYTAIGIQTNIAARIQAHCKPEQILISDATYQLVQDRIDCTSEGEVDCKGVHYKIAVYSPSTNDRERGADVAQQIAAGDV